MDDLTYNILSDLEFGYTVHSGLYNDLEQQEFYNKIYEMKDKGLVSYIPDKSEIFKGTPTKIFITPIGKQAFKEEDKKRNNK